MPADKAPGMELLRLLAQVRPFLKWFLFASAVIAVALAVYARIIFRPTYVSEAIALIRPQVSIGTESGNTGASASSLLAHPLNITDYVLLLRSDSALSAVAEAYNQEAHNQYGDRDPAKRVTVAGLKRRLYARERLELKTPYQVRYNRTLTMRVNAPSSEMAYRLATIWVDVVERRTHDITFAAREEAAAYLDTEHQRQRASLAALENEFNKVKDKTGELLDALQLERSSLEEQYAVDTIKQVQNASDEWDLRIAEKSAQFSLPLLETQIAAETWQLEALQGELRTKKLSLAQAQAQLEELAKEKELHADFLVLGKAVTDDALWSAELDTAKDPGTASVEALKLRSQEINPIAQEISQKIADAKVLVAATPREIAELEGWISVLQDQITEMQANLFSKQTILTVMARGQESEIESIETARVYGIEDLQRRTEIEIDMLTRERKALEDQLERDFTTEVDIFTSLAESRLEAKLALANTIEEFQIISEPTVPEEPNPVSLLPTFVGGFLSSFVLLILAAMGFVFVKEIYTNIQAATQKG